MILKHDKNSVNNASNHLISSLNYAKVLSATQVHEILPSIFYPVQCGLQADKPGIIF